jgi:hypothetical protein
MDYFDAISRLPLPTPEQTVRFANHVVRSHSWYKHLPFFPPGETFVFYLNPRVGWKVTMNLRGDEPVYTVSERKRGWNRFLSAADYRDRFGHWDFFCAGRQDDPEVYSLCCTFRDYLHAMQPG